MEEIIKEYWRGREHGKLAREYISPFIRALREKIAALGWEPHEITLVGIGRDARPILDLLKHEDFFKVTPEHLLPISRGHVVVERVTHETNIRSRLRDGDRSVVYELGEKIKELMKKDPGFRMEVERIGKILQRVSKNGKRLLVLLDSGHLGTQPLILQAIADVYGIPSITAILYAYPEPVRHVHDVAGNSLRTELEKKTAVDLWERFPKFTKPTHTTKYEKVRGFEKQFAKYVARMAGVIHEMYGERAAESWLKMYLPYWKENIRAAMVYLLKRYS